MNSCSSRLAALGTVMLLLAGCHGGTSPAAPDGGPSTTDAGSDAGVSSGTDGGLDGGPNYACAPSHTVTAALPSDTWVFDSDRAGNHEIFLMQEDGSNMRQLTHDASYDCWWGKISPDRTRILFSCAPAGHSEDYTLASLWVMNSDGSERCILRQAHQDGWTIQGHEEWSPDGLLIALAGGPGNAAELYAISPDAGVSAQLTARNSITTDVSWAPNGKYLVTNSCATAGAICDPSQFEIFLVNLAGGAFTRLTHDSLPDYDPYFSRDMSAIAWLRHSTPPPDGGALGGWGIYLMSVDGGAQRALIDDGNINSKPAYSLDGGQILFHRLVYGAPDGFQIWGIQPDGGNLHQVTHLTQGHNQYPSN